MPIWMIAFFSWLFLFQVANDFPKEEYRCIERPITSGGSRRGHELVEDYSIAYKLVPWPFRRGLYSIALEPGDKNVCTEEVWNGSWWYRP